MTRLTEMVEPKRPVRSDLDGQPEAQRSWLGCAGWAAVLSFCLFPSGVIAHDAIKSARDDAQFRREMAAEKRELRKLVQELAKGNEEEKRLARELIAELEKGRAQ